MIKAEILAKMSNETLEALKLAVQTEIDRRMDYTLKFGELCYAIVKGQREEFILRGWKRTRAQVECVKTGTMYSISKQSLKAVGRPLNVVPDYVPPKAPIVPKTTAESVW